MKSMASGHTQKTHVSAVHQITVAPMDKSYQWAHIYTHNVVYKKTWYMTGVLSYHRDKNKGINVA